MTQQIKGEEEKNAIENKTEVTEQRNMRREKRKK